MGKLALVLGYRLVAGRRSANYYHSIPGPEAQPRHLRLQGITRLSVGVLIHHRCDLVGVVGGWGCFAGTVAKGYKP